mmetsp:Transcript_1792/g.1680  ORF Transcript_1792/g.1680 Transcript_1792/m.1680 type:complete len:228 (+) Transcript_1792:65-748(+)
MDKKNVDPNVLFKDLIKKIDSKSIQSQIDGNLLLLYNLVDCILATIEDSKTSEKVMVFCFDELERLIKKYGICMVLLINNDTANKALTRAIKQGYQSEIYDLLVTSLSLFSFDEQRTSVPYLAKMYHSYLPNAPFPDEKVEETNFIRFFKEIYSLIKKSTGIEKLPYNQKLDIAKGIKKCIDAPEKFESDEYNLIEQNFLAYYNEQLTYTYHALPRDIKHQAAMTGY